MLACVGKVKYRPCVYCLILVACETMGVIDVLCSVVNLFLVPSASYIDVVATLVRVPRACGGRLYNYPAFDRASDSTYVVGLVFDATQSQALEIFVVFKLSEGKDGGGRAYAGGGRLLEDASILFAVLYTGPPAVSACVSTPSSRPRRPSWRTFSAQQMSTRPPPSWRRRRLRRCSPNRHRS